MASDLLPVCNCLHARAYPFHYHSIKECSTFVAFSQAVCAVQPPAQRTVPEKKNPLQTLSESILKEPGTLNATAHLAYWFLYINNSTIHCHCVAQQQRSISQQHTMLWHSANRNRPCIPTADHSACEEAHSLIYAKYYSAQRITLGVRSRASSVKYVP